MGKGTAFAPVVVRGWCRRRNLLPGLALMALAAAGWAYVGFRSTSTGGMGNPAVGDTEGAILFLLGWMAMLTAMMVPATLPLILLYRTIARGQRSPVRPRVGIPALLLGYLAIWAVAGLPIYLYTVSTDTAGSTATALPASLLAAAGIYQFTSLKRACQARCSSPLFFLMQNWHKGAVGAMRLGLKHGLDCVGCCAGVMVALAALGMMNLAWMSTTAVVVFAEKNLPGGQHLARAVGAVMVAGGAALLVSALFGSSPPGVEHM